MKKIQLLFFVALLLSACQKQGKDAEKQLFAKLDSTQTGIGFINRLAEDDKLSILDYLYYYNGGGVAAGDINNDGLTDLFFVSNRGKNKLYLNKGNLKFEDISEKAGIGGFADWKTGVTMADVNGDGLLDIYVCAVSNYKGLEGSNELYLNNGDMTFTESAVKYGLDFAGFATQAAFFDYDKDGDLDMYLLTHAVHTARSYEKVSARDFKSNEAGDYLFRNDSPAPKSPKGTSEKLQEKESANTQHQTPPSGAGGLFTDISKEAGIYQAAMGYGLGVCVADLNNDGWDDIYVGNDFHEDDYYYVNNHDGTFTESVKKAFPHLSRFSMGCDIADINNDGLPEVMTTDMYPEDETTEKSSKNDDPLDIYQYKSEFGYHQQYSKNSLQLNYSGKKFVEIASMAGVAATDWSWSNLMADFDNDGIKDIFVANGIVKRPLDLDYLRFIYTDSVKYPMINGSTQYDKKAIALMPTGKVHNYIFKGSDSLHFADKSVDWGFEEPDISNGATYADLDNDGDLEIITNNINEPAGIYLNKSREPDTESKEQGAGSKIQPSYLKIKFQGEKPNIFGFGTKVLLKTKGKTQYQQLSPTRGFMSSTEPALLFGLADSEVIDTLAVVWENRKMELKTNVKANQLLTLKQADAQLDESRFYEMFFPKTVPLFEDISEQFAKILPYKHQENIYYDFNRESLMPFKISTEGPKIAVGDVNGDGLDDLYLCGAKWQAGSLLVQQADGRFTTTNQALFRADSTYEDVDAVFFDADNDKDLDLYVVTGGNEFYGKSEQLFDRLYLNDGKGNFTKGKDNLPAMYDNKSCVKPFDFDKDGDLDLFVGGRVVGYAYGKTPNSYLLVNDGKGKFSDETDKLAPNLRKAGLVTDAIWSDYDNDKDMDLLAVGDWMSPVIFENNGGKFEVSASVKNSLGQFSGFWQTVAAADFDKDGDMDYLLGNLGTNTKLQKKPNDVLKMYAGDLDKNDTFEQILSCGSGENFYPIAGKDEFGKQMPAYINPKFTDYKSFAGKRTDEIFTKKQLDSAVVLEVNKFESVYLENLGNKQFRPHNLPLEAQTSKIYSFYVDDIDKDGNLDVLLGGNLYGVSVFQGRYDSNYGLLLKGNGKGGFKSSLPTDNGFLLEGEVRDIKTLKTKNGLLYLVARNGTSLQVFKTK
jgi:hypothetical protein